MSKRKTNWDDPAITWDAHTGEFHRELTIDQREVMREYDGVGLTPNPAPGPKWQAAVGIMRLNLNGPEVRVLWCLIDHASKRAGYCWPSEQRVADIIDIPLRTVQRAIASLKELGFIETIERFNERGKTSNAYFIQWGPIFAAYEEIKQAKAGKPERPKFPPNLVRGLPLEVAGTMPPKVAGTFPPKVADKLSNRELPNLNYRNELSTLKEDHSRASDPPMADRASSEGLLSSRRESPAPERVESPKGRQEREFEHLLQRLNRCADPEKRLEYQGRLDRLMATTATGGGELLN